MVYLHTPKWVGSMVGGMDGGGRIVVVFNFVILFLSVVVVVILMNFGRAGRVQRS